MGFFRQGFATLSTVLQMVSHGILTSPTATNITENSAGIGVRTSEGSGTLYWSVTTLNAKPAPQDVVDGTGAVTFGNQPVTAPGLQGPITATIPDPVLGKPYFYWFTQEIA